MNIEEVKEEVKEEIKEEVKEEIKVPKSSTRIYRIWLAGIKSRCYNKNHSQYANYGGRGIYVCDEWLNNFEAFRDWSETHGYSDNLEIDRIDNNGPYAPNNCRWVTRKVNARNTRRTVRVTINGITKAAIDWEDETGITNLRNRIKWEVPNELLLDPELDEDHYCLEWTRKKNLLDQYHITYQGETKTLMQFAEENNLHYQTLVNRIKAHGYTTGEELMNYIQRRKHHKNVKVTYNGESLTVKEWAKKLGINHLTILMRLQKGFPLDLVFYKGNIRREKQKELNNVIGKTDERKIPEQWNKN